MRENADQNNSDYGHFSRSVYYVDQSCKIPDRLSKLLELINEKVIAAR